MLALAALGGVALAVTAGSVVGWPGLACFVAGMACMEAITAAIEAWP